MILAVEHRIRLPDKNKQRNGNRDEEKITETANAGSSHSLGS
jgi:hypothetical protein